MNPLLVSVVGLLAVPAIAAAGLAIGGLLARRVGGAEVGSVPARNDPVSQQDRSAPAATAVVRASAGITALDDEPDFDKFTEDLQAYVNAQSDRPPREPGSGLEAG